MRRVYLVYTFLLYIFTSSTVINNSVGEIEEKIDDVIANVDTGNT